MFICLVFVYSCSNESIESNTYQNNTAYRSKITGGSITLDIGRTSRNCRGLGICRVAKASLTIDNKYTITYTNPNSKMMGESTIELKCNYESIDKDSFYLLIDKSIIGELKDIQGGDNFIFEEDFIFDKNMTDIMGISENFTVEESSIPIIYFKDNDLYKILIVNSNK